VAHRAELNRDGSRFDEPDHGKKCAGRQQVFKPDRQLSDANACRMIDCVGNGRSGAHIAQLSNALDANGIDEIVFLRNKDHCFVRYADNANVYVRSRRAGERVMALLRRLYGKLRLTVNETKSAVTRVFGRKFLGYSFWVVPGGAIKRKVVVKPLMTFK
jgi:hypothetical protein